MPDAQILHLLSLFLVLLKNIVSDSVDQDLLWILYFLVSAGESACLSEILSSKNSSTESGTLRALALYQDVLDSDFIFFPCATRRVLISYSRKLF